MGFLFQGYTLISVIGFIGLIVALIFINEITRKSKKLSIIVYCILPIILVFLIKGGVVSSPSSETWFGVIKTYSALAGVIGFMVIRYTKVGNSKFAWYFPVAILGINILEAIFREIEVFNTYKTLTIDSASGLALLGGPWNIMNAVAGILLIITMTGWMGIKVADTKSKDMIWADQLWFWIIAYDIWNIAYCYNCISTRAMYSGVVLIVGCTVAEFFLKRGVWLQHRAQILAVFGMFSLAVDYNSMEAFSIQATYSPEALTALSAAALVINIAVLVYEIITIVKTKRNPIKEEVYVNLKSYQNNIEANNL